MRPQGLPDAACPCGAQLGKAACRHMPGTSAAEGGTKASARATGSRYAERAGLSSNCRPLRPSGRRTRSCTPQAGRFCSSPQAGKRASQLRTPCGAFSACRTRPLTVKAPQLIQSAISPLPPCSASLAEPKMQKPRPFPLSRPRTHCGVHARNMAAHFFRIPGGRDAGEKTYLSRRACARPASSAGASAASQEP